MMNNNLNEKMVNDKNVRDENLAQLVEGMKNDALVRSDIWNLGEDSVFEMFIPNFMNTKNVSELFNAPRKTVNNHPIGENSKELQDAGCEFISYKKWQELLKTLNWTSGVQLSNSNSFGNFEQELLKVLKSMSENEVKLIKFPTSGTWVFSIRAVIKLGMFMTGTEKARLFRDKIIDELGRTVVLEEAVKEQNEKTLSFILDMAEQGEIISVDKLFDVIEAMSKTTALNTLTGIDKAIKDIDDIKTKYENLREELRENIVQGTILPGSKLRTKAKIDSITTLVENLAAIKDEYKDIKDRFKDKLFSRVKTIADKNLTDIICERDEECKKLQDLGKAGRLKLNTLIKEYKDALVEVGVLYTEEYTKNEGKTDASGKDISKKAYNYLPTEKYEWIGESTVGCFSRTHTAQTIKLSEYGAMCFNYMFDMIESKEGFKDFKEEDFKDYLVSLN